jgi:hypothetical protein
VKALSSSPVLKESLCFSAKTVQASLTFRLPKLGLTECLLSKHEALSSKFSIKKKKKGRLPKLSNCRSKPPPLPTCMQTCISCTPPHQLWATPSFQSLGQTELLELSFNLSPPSPTRLGRQESCCLYLQTIPRL